MSRLLLKVFVAALWLPIFGIAQTNAQSPAAQPAASIGPLKIVWIELERAIYSCDEGKKEFTEVQKFVDSKNDELEKKRKDAEADKNTLAMQQSKITDEARADLEEQIEAKETILQRFQQDTQKEIEAKRVRIANFIGKKMVQVIDKLAKEKGWDSVLNINASRDLFLNPMYIVTEDVVKAYNQNNPVKASSPLTPAKKQ
jgi:outer membrane protein